jgi:hypothetical protein
MTPLMMRIYTKKLKNIRSLIPKRKGSERVEIDLQVTAIIKVED